MRLESRTSTLQELYAEETAKIREHFEVSGDGRQPSGTGLPLIDSVVFQLWKEVSAIGEPLAGFALRRWEDTVGALLFPYSDIDLLFSL